MPNDTSDRRQFSRITFDRPTVLRQGDSQWEVNLLDLSLKGLLIETPADWRADTSATFEATIHLNDEVSITMQLGWRHAEFGRTGFECVYIDIDSISHLRRLVELNLGDPDMLERELSVLGTPDAE